MPVPHSIYRQKNKDSRCGRSMLRMHYPIAEEGTLHCHRSIPNHSAISAGSRDVYPTTTVAPDIREHSPKDQRNPQRSGESSSIVVQAMICAKTDSLYSRELNSKLTKSLVQWIKLKRR